MVGARVLVVGGGGFIGRHLVAALAGRGAVVYATRRPGGAPVAALLAAPPHRAHEVDLATPGSLASLVRDAAPAVVFDVAGYGVLPGQSDEALALRLNVELPGELVDAIADARDAGLLPAWRGPRLVHAGTVQEYGAAGGDLVESTPPRPTTLYGRSKLEGTQRLLDRARARGLTAVVARLFMVYGPGEPAGRLLPSLAAAARRSEPIALTDGAQRRDFVHVADAVEGIVRLAGCERIAAPEIVNVASGRLTSVRELILAAARLLALDAKNLHFGALPTRPDEQRHEPASNARLRELTGWVPAIPLEDGLRSTLAAG